MEHTPEQAAEGYVLVKVLAAVLERLVNTNAALARSDPGQVTKFHALKAPGIGVEQYLERIHKYASCSNECFILALIYIDRLIQRNNFLLTELNVHRVVITAILLAAKFFDDAYYNNAYYSKVGGVLVSEMNGLEVDFLFRINFSLHVSPEVFDKYRAELVAHSINSGLLLPSIVAAEPLAQIAEVEIFSNGSNSGMVTPEPNFGAGNNYAMQQPQQHHSRCDQAPSMPVYQDFTTAGVAAIGHQRMGPTPQVTPSPTSHGHELGFNQAVGPLHAPPTVDQTIQAAHQGNHSRNTFACGPPSDGTIAMNVAFPEQAAQLYVSAPLNDQHHYQESVGSGDYGFAVGVAGQTSYADLGYAVAEQQQHQAMLQRTHSLPPPISSGRCVDHGRKPPYYSAPPMASMLAPIMNLDAEQYNLMMSQLFPIQTTLVHHNHGVPDDQQHSHHHHHQAVHPGLQGAGIGSLVMHY